MRTIRTIFQVIILINSLSALYQEKELSLRFMLLCMNTFLFSLFLVSRIADNLNIISAMLPDPIKNLLDAINSNTHNMIVKLDNGLAVVKETVSDQEKRTKILNFLLYCGICGIQSTYTIGSVERIIEAGKYLIEDLQEKHPAADAPHPAF